MTGKPSPDWLLKNLDTPGWEIKAGGKDAPVSGTLEEALRKAHDRKQDGQTSLIRHIETELELNAIQIAELWKQMGLPD